MSDTSYTQQQLLDSVERVKRARETLAEKQRGTSPVENGVDMKTYSSLPEGAVEKDMRLLFGSLQKKVLDLELRVVQADERLVALETMLSDTLNQLTLFIGELEDQYKTPDTVGPERYEVE